MVETTAEAAGMVEVEEGARVEVEARVAVEAGVGVAVVAILVVGHSIILIFQSAHNLN